MLTVAPEWTDRKTSKQLRNPWRFRALLITRIRVITHRIPDPTLRSAEITPPPIVGKLG